MGFVMFLELSFVIFPALLFSTIPYSLDFVIVSL